MTTTLHRATPADAAALAPLIGELLQEIMDAIGSPAFHFDLGETRDRLEDFLRREVYSVFFARAEDGTIAGLIALSESHALYAEGAFGIIPELYVRPAWRSRQVGLALLAAARDHGRERGWSRLEVTTPPLPEFDRTLQFYQREGFAISGGRKLKIEL